MVIPSLNAEAGLRAYPDSPRVLLVTRRPDSSNPERGVTEYDLLRDRIRTIARDASGDRAAAETRVWFGMLEGALEHELAAGAVSAAGGSEADLLSTTALVGPDGVEALGRADADRIRALARDESLAERLTTALATAHRIVVPKVASDVPLRGWWEIGPDATTRAVIDGGLGGTVYRLGSPRLEGRIFRPGSTPGGTGEINPETLGDVGRSRWDGSWERFGRVPPSRGTNEYSTLLAVLAVANILIWSIISFEVMYYVEQAGGLLAALPIESTPD
jgi:hypothetical protein